jgi:electron transfer flavoprotein alpha subunit
MPGVIVFGELSRDGLHESSLEALTVGALLSSQLGEPLIGALLGTNARPAVAGFQRGPERVLLCEGEELRQYDGERFAVYAHRLVTAAAARVVLAPHTMQTRDWMPRLAARMDAGLVMDCTALAAQGDALLVTRPIFGGSVLGDFILRGTTMMVTLSPGAFEPAATTVPCAVTALAPADARDSAVTLIEEIAGDSGDGVRLQDAKIVVSGGRGVGGPENWHYIEKAAQDLDAAIGCSRPVVDAGWVASRHQVGMSGTTVAPEVYIAVGISGAVHHLAGIAAARTVVAINTDAEAGIFRRANYGAVGDFREVLPAFVARVRELRGG